MQKVFPTKANLIKTKNSLRLSRSGYDLLDKKRNILIKEALSLLDEAGMLQKKVASAYIEAYDYLQKANISLGISDTVAGSIPPDDSINLKSRSFMGVILPEISLNSEEFFPEYPLRRTDINFDKSVQSFIKVKELTLKLAEIESRAYRLSVAIKKTAGRANALKTVVIPQYEETVKNITEILEEREREEFSRLKVIKKPPSEK